MSEGTSRTSNPITPAGKRTLRAMYLDEVEDAIGRGVVRRPTAAIKAKYEALERGGYITWEAKEGTFNILNPGAPFHWHVYEAQLTDKGREEGKRLHEQQS